MYRTKAAPTRAGKRLLIGLLSREIGASGASRHLTVAEEARPVAGAVPHPLQRVPLNDAAEMRAHGGSLVQRTAVVAVHRTLLEAQPYNGALARVDRVGIVDVAAREPFAVVPERVEVLLQEVARADREA